MKESLLPIGIHSMEKRKSTLSRIVPSDSWRKTKSCILSVECKSIVVKHRSSEKNTRLTTWKIYHDQSIRCEMHYCWASWFYEGISWTRLNAEYYHCISIYVHHWRNRLHLISVDQQFMWIHRNKHSQSHPQNGFVNVCVEYRSIRWFIMMSSLCCIGQSQSTQKIRIMINMTTHVINITTFDKHPSLEWYLAILFFFTMKHY
jgi:hypothetical protein